MTPTDAHHQATIAPMRQGAHATFAVLLIEEPHDLRQFHEQWMTRCGHRVRGASTVAQALLAVELEHHDVAVLDWQLAGQGAQDFVAYLCERVPSYRRPPLIIMTSTPLVMPMPRGVQVAAVVRKTIDPSTLHRPLRDLTARLGRSECAC